MESGSVIFLAVLVAVIVIPMLIISSNKKKKEKLFLQALFDLAEKSNCKISEHEIWHNAEIGIDKTARKLFFIRKAGTDVVTSEVDLAEMQRCRFVNTNRSVSNGSSNQTVIERLELVFTNQDRNKVDAILDFYNSEYDSLTLRGEIQLAEKWAEVANSMIVPVAQRR